MYEVIKKCRSCGQEPLEPIIDMGETSLAGALLWQDELDAAELIAPLVLVFCPNCALVQLNVTVPREMVYSRDSAYFLSSSGARLLHSRTNAQRIMQSRQLGDSSLIIEAAGKNGYMLQNFIERGFQVLGIDPDVAAAKIAARKGINTLSTFFSRQLASALSAQGTKADIFFANNLPALVADANDVVEGIGIILKSDGLAVVEVPYLLDMIDNNECDRICHQHLSYFSATSMDFLFRQHGLYINHLEQTTLPDSSLRLFVASIENVQDSVRTRLDYEHGRGINTIQPYAEFAENAQRFRRSLRTILLDIKDRGERIVGYGAGARATILLSFCGIDQTILDYIVDVNPLKHGYFMGGNLLPITSTNKLIEDMPDYVLILASHAAEDIINQQRTYYQRGGDFIVPFPSPRILDEDEIRAIVSPESGSASEKRRSQTIHKSSPDEREDKRVLL